MGQEVDRSQAEGSSQLLTLGPAFASAPASAAINQSLTAGLGHD